MVSLIENEKPYLEARRASENGGHKDAEIYDSPSTSPSDVDDALKIYQALGGEHVDYTDEQARRVLRKIDFIMLPVMCTVYGLQYLDKTTLSYASVMGITKDIHLTKDEYNWLGSLFYFGMPSSLL